MMLCVNVIKIIVLIMSLSGYYLILNKKLKVKQELCPVIIFSSIGLIVFISGIINIMKAALFVVPIIGIVFFIAVFLKTTRKISIKVLFTKALKNLTPGFVFFILLCVYLFLLLHNEKFTVYDNFSHWGTVLKYMMYCNHFPVSYDSIIVFESYPTGMTSLLWFFCKFIGYSEGNAMFLQSVFLLSCLLPLFSFIRSKRRIIAVISFIVAAIACLGVLTYGGREANGMYNLLVDDVLGIIPVAAFAIIAYYKDEIQKAALLVLPLGTFVVTAKSSGIIWALVIAVFVFFYAEFSKNCGRLKILILTGINLVFPALMVLMWNIHTKIVFESAESSAHAISVNRYLEVLSDKTPEDIYSIIRLFTEKIFSFNNPALAIFLAASGILILFRIKNRSLLKEYHLLFNFILILGTYLIYQAGNLLMYVFSMDRDSALILLCYERYAMTAEFFLWGIVLINAVQLLQHQEFEKKKLAKKYTALFCILISFLLVYNRSAKIHQIIIGNDEKGRSAVIRERLEKLISENGIEEGSGKKFMIYEHGPMKDDYGLRWYMSRYLLFAVVTDIYETSDINDMGTAPLSYYDNILAMTLDEEFIEWLNRNNLPASDFIDTSELSFVTLQDYLSDIDHDNSLIVISGKADSSYCFNSEMEEEFSKIGLKRDLKDAYGQSYLAVIAADKVIFEEMGMDEIRCSQKINGLEINAVSGGIDFGNNSSIVIDGSEYSKNGNGLNIVVVDLDRLTVVSSMNFNTGETTGAYYCKQAAP